MKAEERHLAAGGDGAAVEEPLFTEEAEEEARPVVPLGRVGDGGPASGQVRGRLPRSFILALAVIAAGAAGATAGLLTYIGRAPRPAAEATTGVAPEPNTPQTAVSGGAETPTAEKSDARAEPERPTTNKADVRGRDAEERAERAREEEEPRREDEEVRAERRRGGDEKRAERRDEKKDGKPKARLVGTITERRQP